MTKPIIIILLLIFASSKIYAKEIRINSNELEIDREKKISTCIGNVYVNEKDMINNVEVWKNGNIIKCDELVLDIKNSTSIMKSKANQRVEALIISNWIRLWFKNQN